MNKIFIEFLLGICYRSRNLTESKTVMVYLKGQQQGMRGCLSQVGESPSHKGLQLVTQVMVEPRWPSGGEKWIDIPCRETLNI